jgi:hypothetical protein
MACLLSMFALRTLSAAASIIGNDQPAPVLQTQKKNSTTSELAVG